MKNLPFAYPLIAFFGAIVVACTFSGCNQNPHAERIETTDSLRVVMTELNEIFEQIDYDQHYANRADMMEDMQRVEQYFKQQNDTMPRDLAMTLSEYRLVWKGYKRMEGEYGQVKEDLEYTTKQLENLKTDLENKAMSESMADRFLNEEKAAVARVDMNTRSLNTKMEVTEKKYNEKKPVVVQLGDSLQNSLN